MPFSETSQWVDVTKPTNTDFHVAEKTTLTFSVSHGYIVGDFLTETGGAIGVVYNVVSLTEIEVANQTTTPFPSSGTVDDGGGNIKSYTSGVISHGIDNEVLQELVDRTKWLNDTKVNNSDVTDAKTAYKIPIRDNIGRIKADVIGNATSATTLSAGADRTTVDSLKPPAFANFGTTAGTVAEGNHTHDSRYFRLDGVTTKMIFVSYPLPIGWVLDTSINDKTLIIQNNTTGVGTDAGSWTISGFNGAGGHNHTTGTSSHNIRYPQSTQASFYISYSDHTHSVSTVGDHTHSHNATWRPSYRKSIIGIKY